MPYPALRRPTNDLTLLLFVLFVNFVVQVHGFTDLKVATLALMCQREKILFSRYSILDAGFWMLGGSRI